MWAYLSAGIILGLSSGFSPGPFMTFVVSHTLAHGVREGVKVSLTPLITDFPIIISSLIFLEQVANMNYFLMGSAAGSIFLFYRAWKSFRTGDVYIATCSKAPNSLRTGVLVNLLNPNPYLFWFTVGSPMLLKGYGQSTACAASFLGAFYVCLLGAKCGIALMVGRSRHLFKGKAYLYTMRLLGVFLLVFAAMLFHSALCYL